MPVRAPASHRASDVVVYAPRCAACGRLGEGGRAWDTPGEAPSPLPRCSCGAEPFLVPVDVNELLLRASASASVVAQRVDPA